MKQLYKVAMASIAIILLSLSMAIAQGNTNKRLKASSDNMYAEAITTESDDIIFCLYDSKMNKIKLNSLSGDCILIFHNAKIAFEIRKIDTFRIKCTVNDFNGYINFIAVN